MFYFIKKINKLIYIGRNRHRRTVLIYGIGGLIAATGSLSHAASPTPQPIDSGQIQRQVDSLPSVTPTTQGLSDPSPNIPAADLSQHSFLLAAVLIEGSTVYSSQDFIAYYERYLGQRVTVADLVKIAGAITRHYRNAGYFLSYALLPSQQIEHGIVRIRVVEGYIAHVNVATNSDSLSKTIDAIFHPVLLDKPLHRLTLDKAFDDLRLLAGLTYKPQLTQRTAPIGAYDLALNSQQKKLGGGISIDNHGVDHLGPIQGTASLQLHDLAGFHETYYLNMSTTNDTDELQNYTLGTSWPLNHSGTRIFAQASKTTARPGDRFAELEIVSRNKTALVGVHFPLRNTPSDTIYTGVSLSIDRAKTEVSGVTRLENNLTNLAVSIRHEKWYTERTRHGLGLSVIQGLNAANSAVSDSLSQSGPGAPDYTTLHLDYVYQHRFISGLSLSMLFDGQYANETLPSLKRYGVGGSTFGRGYDSSEILGDSGLAGRIDLAYINHLTINDWKLSPYGFYDGGVVWQHTPTNNDRRKSLASFGIGVRIVVNQFSAYLEAAKPLTRVVANEGNRNTRLFGGVAYYF